jgi:hypothetical protein
MGETAGIPPYRPGLAARSIYGNVLRTAVDTWAWFWLPTVRWSYRDDAAREGMITGLADALGELGPVRAHLRVTSRPSPISEWAAAHAGGAASRRLPDTSGALSWRDYMLGEQRSLSGWALSDKQVFLGINIGSRTGWDRWCDHAPGWVRARVPELFRAEMAGMDKALATARRVVAALGGREAGPAEMDWLMHRSCSLGLPTGPPEARAVPGDWWDTADLASFTDEAAGFQEPYAPTVTIRALDGTRAQASVAVLSLGAIEPQNIPQADLPWMYQPELLGIGHEWSVRFHIRPAESVKRELAFQGNKAKSQVSHYTEDHRLTPPPALARQAALATRIDDELSSATLARNNRITGYFRLAVAGESEDAAVETAHRVAQSYGRTVRIEHTEAQYAHAREFIPGQRLVSSAHPRRGSLTWLASAMPQVSHQVGDRSGPILGRLAQGPPRLVAWDPWLSMEGRTAGGRDSSGLAALVGGLGSGKTLLAAMIMYKTLRTGAEWTVLDPSGRLGSLAELPELAPYSRVIDLLDATPGMLNPYRVVPEPRREHFADADDPDAELAREKATVAMIRHDMTLAVMKGILSPALQADADTDIVLDAAAAVVEDRDDPHPGMIIEALQAAPIADERLARHAGILGDWFERNRAKLRPLIPEAGADPYAAFMDCRFTVLTMAGLVLPKPGKPRDEWGPAELFNTQLLELAAWLTQRNLYNRPVSTPKGVFIDEAFFLATVPQGKALIDRIARDSRKFHIRALLASQVPSDLLRISGFASLVDAVFLGRLYSPKRTTVETGPEGPAAPSEQAQALELAGIPVGQGYEAELGRLAADPDTGAREFLFADGTGQCERIVADFSAPHLAHVLAAADSTPTRRSQDDPDADTDGDADLEADGPVDGFVVAQQAALARVGIPLNKEASRDGPPNAGGGGWQVDGHLPNVGARR